MGDDVADVLERAADLLWVRGRCKGSYLDEFRQVCPLTAVAVAEAEASGDAMSVFDVYRPTVAKNALGRYVMREFPKVGGAVHRRQIPAAAVYLWNDDTDDDDLVIDTLRRCAKELREVA